MEVFAKCAKEVTIAQAYLMQPETAASEIDRVIVTAIRTVCDGHSYRR